MKTHEKLWHMTTVPHLTTLFKVFVIKLVTSSLPLIKIQ